MGAEVLNLIRWSWVCKYVRDFGTDDLKAGTFISLVSKFTRQKSVNFRYFPDHFLAGVMSLGVEKLFLSLVLLWFSVACIKLYKEKSQLPDSEHVSPPSIKDLFNPYLLLRKRKITAHECTELQQVLFLEFEYDQLLHFASNLDLDALTNNVCYWRNEAERWVGEISEAGRFEEDDWLIYAAVVCSVVLTYLIVQTAVKLIVLRAIFDLIESESGLLMNTIPDNGLILDDSSDESETETTPPKPNTKPELLASLWQSAKKPLKLSPETHPSVRILPSDSNARQLTNQIGSALNLAYEYARNNLQLRKRFKNIHDVARGALSKLNKSVTELGADRWERMPLGKGK